MKPIYVIAVVVLTAVLGAAQTAQQPASAATPAMPAAAASAQPEVFTPADVKWTSFLPGVQMAVLSGDPNASGPYTLRLKMVDGNQIAPHWHPQDENVTVISGTLQVGMGDKFDAAALKPLPVGSHAMMPKEMRHFAKASGETIIELYGEGPFKVIYVNPADDPRNAKH
jgi:anti-sigma factor ChrR (cupin superfamily)